jgi:hypothetical protein
VIANLSKRPYEPGCIISRHKPKMALSLQKEHQKGLHDTLVHDRDEPGVLVIVVAHDTSVSPCPGLDKAHLNYSALALSGCTTAETHACNRRRANR